MYTWPNGDRYEGDWVNGVRQGEGVLEKKNGMKYKGDFVQDKIDGFGV